MVSPSFPISETGEGSLMGILKNLWADDRGQSTTEYILILAVVVMIAMKFKSTFGVKLGNIVEKLGTQLDSATNPSSP
jgi:Flp pilus assembly pilin Flp